MKTKKSLGFTLIELLVVVAIISLLSSVVLTAVREARDKAKGRAFRQEMNELIKAIELYRFDNPNAKFVEDNSSGYRMNSDGVIASGGTWVDVSVKLSPYIKKMPVPPFSGYYTFNRQEVNCVEDGVTNGLGYYYVLIVNGSENIKYFSDWNKSGRWSTQAPLTNTRCFSWR
jgi:prepilin-type N-terminal cleavage/methylation domain-containing protein